MEAPIDNLTRSVAFALERADSDDDGLTLEGYAAVFDSETVIDSWEGQFREQIIRGAFRKTLKERTPVVQFDHGRHPLVGSLPLGSIEQLKEDPHGLYVRARLHDNWLVEPVRDAIASGSVDGMSFRFSVTKEKWEEPKSTKELPLRTIQEVKLFELGPVVFPAYAGTSVGVRSEVADLASDPEFRKELARALMLGADVRTSRPSSDPEGGSDGEEAAEGQEPREHSGVLPSIRNTRMLTLAQEGVTA